MRTYLVVLALLAGCVSGIGERFDPADVDKLQPGISTMADATQLLGKPSTETNYANGNRLLQWQYVLLNTGAHVAVLFDSSGRMIRTTYKHQLGR